MPLSQQHRTSIHDGLSPIVGADAVEALLSEFPATELDRPATEGFVRAEIADLRGEVRTEFANVRGEITVLRGEMRTEFANVRGEIADLRGEMRTEFAAVRGELHDEIQGLRAEFADRFRSQTVWMASALTAGLALATAIARLAG